MIDMAKIDRIEDWLIDQALNRPDMARMFEGLCLKLRDCHVPVDRAMLSWSTLHPLIEAEMAFWQLDQGVVSDQFSHTEQDREDWLNSPMRAVLEGRDRTLRRRLDRGNAPQDFPLCQQLADEGYADYLVIATRFQVPSIEAHRGNTGIMVSWATRLPGGFTDDQIKAIEYIQARLALAAKANVEAQITRTIAETYLGKWAGSRVLNGQIRHGDGDTINAVIFFSDVRDSTAIAEHLGPDNYLGWLNEYFDAAAGAVMEEGGEILDFIGDAVLGVFPIEDAGKDAAIERAVRASDTARERLARLNCTEGRPRTRAGIALSIGEVMFGNIGVPHRLTFSVIGQTVHAAARIEALTKSVGCDVLVTGDIAGKTNGRCRHVGEFDLAGFSTPRPLFALD